MGKVRRVLYNGQWWFSIIDVIEILTETDRPRKYWSDLKKRLIFEGYTEVSDKIGQLKLKAFDGKMRLTDCANTETMLRIIQSIPSKKAEPFKRWLARVGKERLENTKKYLSRKKNRLPEYDYSKNGSYFVTICTQDRREWFGEIIDEEMRLNKYGQIVKQQWEWLHDQYNYVDLGFCTIMPNHLHGIIKINNPVGNGRDRSLSTKSLSSLIGAFKTTSSKTIHQNGLKIFKWQKSFYDHIIRNENSLHDINKYIINNPKKWANNRNNFAQRN